MLEMHPNSIIMETNLVKMVKQLSERN